MDHGAMVTVGAFTTVAEAEAARLLLEAKGIPCVLSDAETVSMAWIMSNAVGGVKLQVPEAEAARARRVLARQANRRRAPGGDDYGLDEPLDPRGQRDTPAEDLDEPAAPPDPHEADATVDRAWRAALLGLVFCPGLLRLYSLFLLLQLPWVSSRVSPDRHARLAVALAVDAVVMLALIAVLQMFPF